MRVRMNEAPGMDPAYGTASGGQMREMPGMAREWSLVSVVTKESAPAEAARARCRASAGFTRVEARRSAKRSATSAESGTSVTAVDWKNRRYRAVVKMSWFRFGTTRTSAKMR